MDRERPADGGLTWLPLVSNDLEAAGRNVQYRGEASSISLMYTPARMELRHLRYFVAVAEERNFTRAAAKLGIQQPPLSSQIRQLEAEMGAPLFRRLTRGVELTESGVEMLDRARWILLCVDQAKVDVQRRARGEVGRINVGFAGATYFQPLIPRIVLAYRERYPDVILSPVQSSTMTLLADLHRGETDLAFVRPPLVNAKGIDAELLVEEPMLLVLPASHRLARNRSVALASLADETFVIPARSFGPNFYDAFIASCWRAGFSPKLGQEASQIAALVPMVGSGFGVSIVPRSVSVIRCDNVVYRPIRGAAPKAAISLAYRHDENSAAVRKFVALAKRHSRT
jgi:DNA-binding transcriptional LysR family regulator